MDTRAAPDFSPNVRLTRPRANACPLRLAGGPGLTMLRPVRLRALVPLALLAACGGAPTSVDPAAVAPSPPTPPPPAASDAGAPADAGSGPAPSSLPFGVKPSTWTWVDVPGTRCGNG